MNEAEGNSVTALGENGIAIETESGRVTNTDDYFIGEDGKAYYLYGPPAPFGDEERFTYNWTGEYVTSEFKAKVVEICDKLQMNPDDLMAIMAFESGGIDPTARCFSGATGLIQFMPSTAESLGTTTDALSKMSATEQLDYVYKYFKPYTGKIDSIYDAYMVVLLPIAVGKDNSFIIGEQNSTEHLSKSLTKGKFYEQNSGLDINRDGIITKEEAAKKVIGRRNTYSRIN